MLRVAFTAVHGGIVFIQNSMQREGLSYLLRNIAMANHTAIRHSLALPEGRVAFFAFIADLRMRNDAPRRIPGNRV